MFLGFMSVGLYLFLCLVAFATLGLLHIADQESRDSAENSSGVVFWSAFMIGVAMFIGWVGFDMNPIGYIADHWIAVTVSAVLYFVIGALWSLAKWWLRLREFKRQHDRQDTPEKQKQFVKFHDYRVDIKKQGGRIRTWITLWPISMLHSLLWEVLRGLVGRIYDMLTGTYERIKNSVLGDIKFDNLKK